MKKKLKVIGAILFFTAGLGILLYPTVSNWINERNQTKVVAGYSEVVSGLTEADYTQQLEAAEKHNERIAQAGKLAEGVRVEMEDNLEEYGSLLNVGGNGVMGVIRIPKIRVSLPIYHTTDEAVLQVGVGHFIGSSLPVGGENTHCVLTGHRGLPSSKLFTDLDQIEEGDVFYMDVFGDTLAYQVDQIQVVLPEEVDELDVIPGGDFVTLVTCTPYGVNSHRMLIRGTRIPYVEEETAQVQAVEAAVEAGGKLPGWVALAVAGVIMILAAAAIGNSISWKKPEQKKTGRKKASPPAERNGKR